MKSQQSNKIYLWGFMGSGKSTVGKSLANSLKWEFVDLDDQISKQENSSIVDIFYKHGEKYFRKCEKETLKKITTDAKNTVIACGGGTPIFKKMSKIMLSSGTCVYLKCEPDVLMSRLSETSSSRPLIKALNKKQLRKRIEQIMSEREHIYAKADLQINNNGSLKSTITSIIQQLNLK